MRTLDLERIVICAVMALCGAFGLVTGIAAFAGICLRECSAVALSGVIGTIGGLLWGILLIFNSNKLSKRV